MIFNFPVAIFIFLKSFFLQPELADDQKYVYKNFIPVEIFNIHSRQIIFGNSYINERPIATVIQISADKFFANRITDSPFNLKQVKIFNDNYYLVGTFEISKQGGIIKLDSDFKTIWIKQFDFQYENNLCCFTTQNNYILVAGDFYDKESLANLQILKLGTDGKILDGKSFYVGYQFEAKAIWSDKYLWIIGNVVRKNNDVIIMKLNKNLEIISKKFLSTDKFESIDNVYIEENLITLVGTKDNRIWFMQMDKNLNPKKDLTLNINLNHPKPLKVQKYLSYFAISVIDLPKNNVLNSYLMGITPDGNVQWTEKFNAEIFTFAVKNKTISLLGTNADTLLLRLYSTKQNPAAFSKVLSSSSNQTPKFLAVNDSIIIISQKNDPSAPVLKIWILDPSLNLIRSFSIPNFNNLFINAFVDKNIWIFTKDGSAENFNQNSVYIISSKTQQKSLILPDKTEIIQIKHADKFFLLIGKISKKSKGIRIGLMNKNLELVWYQDFIKEQNIFPIDICYWENHIFVLASDTLPNVKSKIFYLLKFTSDGRLITGKKYKLLHPSILYGLKHLGKKLFSFGQIEYESRLYGFLLGFDFQGNIILDRSYAETSIINDLQFWNNRLIMISNDNTNLKLLFADNQGNLQKGEKYSSITGNKAISAIFAKKLFVLTNKKIFDHNSILTLTRQLQN